ncbi:deoxyribonuclease IV [Candidatus Dependentiae bacterium]|nr:MAG: deoxyribonuclease IV [Candidatus Dependentiae bacterium]
MPIQKNIPIQKKPLLIGAHMSIKHGFGEAIQDGASIQCKAIQFFTKSNRQWYAKKIMQKDITLLNEALIKSHIDRKNVIVHASYLINLASSNNVTAKKSYDGLLEELERCAILNLPYLVLHPGAATESTTKEGIAQITFFLEEIMQKSSENVMVLLENMAGQGTVIGKNFQELALIINGLSMSSQKKVGICIDTCHLFAAGIPFDTQENYESTWQSFDKLIGRSKIKVIHLNDSKSAYGSHVDRHEHITKGKIPIKSFKMILNDPLFTNIPKILETPHASLSDHLMNIQQVEYLYNN